MSDYEEDIVAEVRRHREELLKEHGGIEGYLQYLKERRPYWESQGFKLTMPEEVHSER
jgi:hypothetical protein